jgi:hypothetical protein
MSRTMFGIDSHDSFNAVFILRRMGERRLVVMEEYRD